MSRLFIVSDCGGVGRTTVSANLAHAFAARGQRVRLRDEDAQQSLAVHFRSLDAVGGSREKRPVANLRYRPLAPNIDLLLGDGIDLRSHPAITDRRASREPGIEIVDTPSAWSATPRDVGPEDHVLCVVTPDARCFRTLPSLLERHADAAEQGLRRNFLGLVNAFEPESSIARDTHALLEDAFGGRLLQGTVLRDTSLPEAFAAGLPIAEYAPWSQAADAFGRIADTLIALRAATDAAA